MRPCVRASVRASVRPAANFKGAIQWKFAFLKKPVSPPPPKGGRNGLFQKSRPPFSSGFSKSLYLEIDESSEALVFEIRFAWLSAFRFVVFCLISTSRTRDMAKSKRHLRSIDLVEISRSVVKSSKMDPKNSRYGQFQFSNNNSWISGGNLTPHFLNFQGGNFTLNFSNFRG